MYVRYVLKALLHRGGYSRSLLFCGKNELLYVSSMIYPLVRSSSTALRQDFATESVWAKSTPISVHYKNYLLSKPECKSLLLDSHDIYLETEGRPEFVQLLKNVPTDVDPDEEFLQKLNLTLLKEKEILDFEEICKSFYILYTGRPTSSKHDTLKREIIQNLEEELNSRKLSRSQIIKALMSLKETRGSSYPSFFQRKMTRKVFDKIEQLSPAEVLVFFHSLFKLSLSTVKAESFHINRCLLDNISNFNGTELAIIARGLHYSRLRCCVELKSSFMKRVAEQLECINFGHLLPLIKLLEEKMDPQACLDFLNFQEKFIPYISKYDWRFFLCLALTGKHIGCLNERFWEQLRGVFKENINDFSIPFIERLVFLFAEFDVQDEELLKLAIERFEDTFDLNKNYRSLILLLNHLVHLRVYPKKLFDVGLGEDCLSFVRTGNTNRLKGTFYETVTCLEIDKPEFNCSSLNERDRRKFFKYYKYTIVYQKYYESCFLPSFLKLRASLLSLCEGDKSKMIGVKHPMQRAGIFMKFDCNSKIQPIAGCLDLNSAYPKKLLKDDHIWVFIYLLPKYYKLFQGDKKKLPIQTYMRQLKELGFSPVVVHESLFTTENLNRQEYFYNLISSHIQNILQQNNRH